MITKPQEELHFLTSKVLASQSLSVGEMQRLEILLQREDFLIEYLKLIEVDTIAEPASRALLVSPPVAPRSSRRSLIGLSVCALLVVALVAVFWQWETPDQGLALEGRTAQASIRGVMGVVWNETPNDFGSVDRIDIESGLVELEHPSGTVVLVEGPAKYFVRGDNEGEVEHGKCVMRVPQGAEGYVLKYKGGEVIDLGTEFAIDANEKEQVKIGVYQGSVEVKAQHSDSPATLEQNMAVAVSSGSKVSRIPFEPSAFKRSIPYKSFRWEVDKRKRVSNFDVSGLVNRPGKYRASLKWLHGGEVEVFGLKLYCNGNLVSKDEHLAKLGTISYTRKNVYFLQVDKAVDPTDKWTLEVTLQALPKAGKQRVSRGRMIIDDMGYKVQASDFIGRWEYKAGAYKYVRVINADGTIVLYKDGEVHSPGFGDNKWKVVDGVLEIQTRYKQIERCMLKDRNTMIFLNQPYADAKRMRD